MRRLKRLVLIFVLASLLVAGGCIFPSTVQVSVFKPPPVDVGTIKIIAICPFQGPDGDAAAHKLITKLFEEEVFSPLEGEKVNASINAMGLGKIWITSQSRAVELGKTLKAEGVIFGSVDEFTVEDSKTEQKVTKYRRRSWFEIFILSLFTRGSVSRKEPYDVYLPCTLRHLKMTITFRMINAESAKLVTVKSITREFERKIIYDPDNPQRLKSEDELLDELVDEITTSFIRLISPYYVIEWKVWESTGVKKGKIARNYFENELFTEAAEILDGIMEGPQLEPEQLAAIYYNRGLIYEISGDLSKAKEYYEKASSIISSNIHLSALKNIRKKIEDFEKLREQEFIEI